MRDYGYTDMIHKINTLEKKIHQLEQICNISCPENYSRFSKNRYCYDSALSLTELTQNLKQDFINKPINYRFSTRKMSSMYDKVNILESRLLNLMQPVEILQNNRTKPMVCCKRADNGRRLPVRAKSCNDLVGFFPVRDVSTQQRGKKCIPPHYFFEKISENAVRSPSSTDSFEEIVYYDTSTTLSDSSSSVTTLVIENYKPHRRKKNIQSRIGVGGIPFDVRKSKSTPAVRNKKIKPFPRGIRKIWHSTQSIWKRPKQDRREKNQRKKEEAKKKKSAYKFGLNKSKSPSINIYSKKTPRQESDVYFLKTIEFPKNKTRARKKSRNEEKYVISQLNRIKSPSKSKSYTDKKNPSFYLQNKDIKKHSDTNKDKRKKKLNRSNSLEYENNLSDTSNESHYIKAKWRRKGDGKVFEHERFQSKTKHLSHPFIVANSSHLSNSPFSYAKPSKYYFTGASRNNTSFSEGSSGDKYSYSSMTQQGGYCYSSDSLTPFSSSESLHISSNRNITDSYRNKNLYLVPEENLSKFSSQANIPNYSSRKIQKVPTAVYTALNEASPNVFRYQNGNFSIPQNNLLFASDQKSYSKMSSNISPINLNNKTKVQNTYCRQKVKTLPGTNRNKDRSKYMKIPTSNYENNKTFLNSFPKMTTEQSIYVSTVPFSKKNLQERFVNNNSYKVNTHLKHDPSFPKKSSQSKDVFMYPGITPKTQIVMKAKRFPALARILSRSLKLSKPKSEPTPPPTKNLSKENISMHENMSTENMLDTEKKVKRKLSLARLWRSSKTKLKESSSDPITQPSKSVKEENEEFIAVLEPNSSNVSKRSIKSFNRNSISQLKENNMVDDSLKAEAEEQPVKESSVEIMDRKKHPQSIKRSIHGGNLGKILKNKPIKSETPLKMAEDKKLNQLARVSTPSSLWFNQPKVIKDSKTPRTETYDSANIFDPNQPRSVSSYYEQLPSVDPTMPTTPIQTSNEVKGFLQRERDFQDEEHFKPVLVKNGSGRKEDIARKKPLTAEEETTKNKYFYQEDFKSLNYTLHFEKEKRRNVEISSLPSFLSLDHLLPADCKTILSVEEIMLSEHKFNGMEMHNKYYECKAWPLKNNNTASRKRRKVYPKRAKSEDPIFKSNIILDSNFVKYHKIIPITGSFWESDNSTAVDWQKIIHEMKIYQ